MNIISNKLVVLLELFYIGLLIKYSSGIPIVAVGAKCPSLRTKRCAYTL